MMIYILCVIGGLVLGAAIVYGLIAYTLANAFKHW